MAGAVAKHGLDGLGDFDGSFGGLGFSGGGVGDELGDHVLAGEGEAGEDVGVAVGHCDGGLGLRGLEGGGVGEGDDGLTWIAAASWREGPSQGMICKTVTSYPR